MSIFKAIYEINEEKEIPLCSTVFFKKNRKKIKMVISNQIVPLIERYKVKIENLKLLKVKFIILMKKNLDLNSMFRSCYALKEFHVISDSKISTEYQYDLYEDDNYLLEEELNICENLENKKLSLNLSREQSSKNFKLKSSIKKSQNTLLSLSNVQSQNNLKNTESFLYKEYPVSFQVSDIVKKTNNIYLIIITKIKKLLLLICLICFNLVSL